MDFAEFSKILGGSAFGVVSSMVFKNYMGIMLWKAQVEREIKAIVDAATKLVAVRLEQIEEERNDKNEEKATTRAALAAILDAIKENKIAIDSLRGRGGSS